MAWRLMGAPADFDDLLYGGVPSWMATPLKEWLSDEFTLSETRKIATEFDSACRNDPPLFDYGWTSFEELMNSADGEDVINFVDFLVYKVSSNTDPWASGPGDEALNRLDGVLLTAGSCWCVGTREGLPGLERRVPLGVQKAADQVVRTTGSAGELLSEAWHAAFGVAPDPEDAYEKAIKAVEEAAAPQVEPRNGKATLGTIIGAMGNDGDWGWELVGKDGTHDFALVRGLCRHLWEGQVSRHGSNGYRKPTQGEAEAAVSIAVLLVQGFASGVIGRR